VLSASNENLLHAPASYGDCSRHAVVFELPGEARMGTVAEPEPATISITIDGTNVKVEDLASMKIYSNDEDVWTFGSGGVGVWYGQINRITGQA
jgi:hypothetical protein